MAKRKTPAVGKSRYRDDLAEAINKIFSNWEQNRKPLQAKWEKNSEAYRAISSGFWKAKETEDWRSNTFLNITKQKVLAAYAIVVDTVLADGKIPFELKPAPWENIAFRELGIDLKKDIEEEIKYMHDLIEQQLLESAADRELMKNVLAAAIYGETWQKDVITETEYSHYEPEFPELPEGVEDMGEMAPENITWRIRRKKRDSRGVIYVPTWDMFWDMENDNLQENAGVGHRQLVSPFWLRQKKGKKYFIDSAIDDVLKDAKSAQHDTAQGSDSFAPGVRDVQFRENTIVYREFWGRLSRETVEAFEHERAVEEAKKGKKPEPPGPEDIDRGDEVEVLVAVADGRVVRYARRQRGKRPFRRCVWEDNMDALGGVGVADNAEDMQLVINGAMRAFEDNKKLSGNLVGGIKPEMFEEEVKSVTPGMLLHLTAECDDIRKGLMFADIPDVGETLISVIHIAQQYADMNTMIPKVQQGIETKEKLTAFEISQLIEKAGKYLGTVIRNFDEMLIEPMIHAFYEHNMDDPKVERGKGDYLIKAMGFTSFQNKVERITKMQQMLGLLLNTPAVAEEVNARWFVEEILKAMDIETDMALKSDEQKQREAELRQPDPMEQLMMQAQQANIAKTQAAAELASSKARTGEEKLAIDRARAVADIQTQRDKTDLEAVKTVAAEGRGARGGV